MLSWRSGLLLAAVLVLDGSADADGSARPTEPATMAQACGKGGLVDTLFRDAALDILQRLSVQAPGQAAHGAVRASLSPGHVDPQGQAWHYVSAYQVNLAMVEALRIAPGRASAVADWVRWQARHTTPTGDGQGVVFDHWVRASDLHEAPCPPGLALGACPQVDAYDSTAASLLLVADAYLAATGDAALLREPTVRAALHAAVATVVALAQPQGLTSAKPGYPVAYLMDAVEVAAGWRAWSRVQARAYDEHTAAQASLAAAHRAEDAIREHLWHAPSRSWSVSLGAGPPKFSLWYPDTVAQAWPLLWGIGADDTGPSSVAQAAWRQAASHWRGSAHWSQRNVDPEGFWWPAAAVAARCVGDQSAARAWVARARGAWMRADQPFAWPFHVGDLRWLFWLSEPLPGAASPPVP